MTKDSSSVNESGARRRLRLGMVGGGEGAFIGAVHRIASRLDNHYELVAGALSAEPEKARRSGMALGLDPQRVYPDFNTMAQAERARHDPIDVVAIVTPNHLHAPIASLFLAAGFHVICDKPLTTRLVDAEALYQQAQKGDRVFCLTHNYTGYPLVRHAREMTQAGQLGTIRLVQVEYSQDWLTEAIELTGQKQAAWRTDPAQSGAGGCLGDIGSHAYQLADFVTGLKLDQLCAELSAMVEGRRLDDNVQMLLRYQGGAKGMLWASQVATGHENDLRLRVYGTRGALEWVQTEPNVLIHSPLNAPRQLITRGSSATGAAAARMTRIPPGHPEGYLEGFANLYAEAALAIHAVDAGLPIPPEVQFPGWHDGLKGMAFIQAAVQSSNSGATWVRPAYV
ncbi:MAG: gfo/Idh/MocA family oxidoreductase [Betaproteobacteria bacterium]|nr:gfo/Idh/MocA family oxidoreductase [Betaproteobacteria bacterium]